MDRHIAALHLIEKLQGKSAYLQQALASLGFDYIQPNTAENDGNKHDVTGLDKIISTPLELSEEPDVEQKTWHFPVYRVLEYQTKKITAEKPFEQQVQASQPLRFSPDAKVEHSPATAINDVKLVHTQSVNNLTVWHKSTTPDALKLTNKIARCQPIKHLPLLQRSGLPAEVWLYIDNSQAGFPFKADTQWLKQQYQRYLGKNNITKTIELKVSHISAQSAWREIDRCGRIAKFKRTQPPTPERGACAIVIASQSQLQSPSWQKLLKALKQDIQQALIVPLQLDLASSIFGKQRLLDEQSPLYQKQLKILLTALSLTPSWINHALLRKLRLILLPQSNVNLEYSISAKTELSYYSNKQMFHWLKGFKEYQTQFDQVFPSAEQQAEVINVIEHALQTLATRYPSFVIEFKLLCLAYAGRWAATLNYKQTVQRYTQQIADYFKAVCKHANQQGSHDSLEYLLGQALMVEDKLSQLPVEITRCTTYANLAWGQANNSQQALSYLEQDVWQEFNQQITVAEPGSLYINPINNSINLIKASEPSLHGLQHLQVMQDVSKALLNGRAITESGRESKNKSSTSLVQPAVNRLETLAESLTIEKNTSQTYYWAKRLFVTPTAGVIADTDFVRFVWAPQSSNKIAPLRTNLKTNKFPFLHEFPPQLDDHGIYSRVVIQGEFSNEPQALTLRYIPPGSFIMGSPQDEVDRDDDEAQHAVSLTSGFWLAETTITQVLWQAVMGDNPSEFKGDNLPVENVSWLDSLKFCQRINQQIKGFNLTLPSEAQWEYACRAGSTGPFNIGDSINNEQANFSNDRTVGVDSFARNVWGLKQMHGNVREWCLDEFENDTSAYQQDPVVNGQQTPEWLEVQLTQGENDAANTQRVLRGGTWGNLAHYCRSAFRLHGLADFRSSFIGLRVAQVERSE
ncbi:SUMF1/EgtB/PvdO family nonheme iron enzyme [Algibacillus agarilyticus]|uniref:SUMF1/EgtB/PvdO family nonheme iron enzyme n=1 Tax=Algibacillus agarilyticus TaxID=2234133 RepID=UPI000DD0AB45|nr:SUMF1/EgtB/PvdO family nonheme iron enzyme [Algibacillus agarilyticus]